MGGGLSLWTDWGLGQENGGGAELVGQRWGGGGAELVGEQRIGGGLSLWETEMGGAELVGQRWGVELSGTEMGWVAELVGQEMWGGGLACGTEMGG